MNWLATVSAMKPLFEALAGPPVVLEPASMPMPITPSAVTEFTKVLMFSALLICEDSEVMAPFAGSESVTVTSLPEVLNRKLPTGEAPAGAAATTVRATAETPFRRDFLILITTPLWFIAIRRTHRRSRLVDSTERQQNDVSDRINLQ